MRANQQPRNKIEGEWDYQVKSSKKVMVPKNYFTALDDSVVGVGTWLVVMIVIGGLLLLPLFFKIVAYSLLIILSFCDLNPNIKNWSKALFILLIVSALIEFFY